MSTRDHDREAVARAAVTWAWPLYEMARMRAATSPRRYRGEAAGPSADSPLRWCNVLVHARELLGPGGSRVVTPNVDTLYSNAWFDLREGPVVLDVPDTGGRYYVLGFLDFYTNPFASVGQRTTGTGAGRFVLVPPGWQGSVPAGLHRIDAPTPWVWMIGRILVDGVHDLAAVHALQDGMRLRPLGPRGPVDAPASHPFDAGFDGAALRDAAPRGARFAQVVNAALAENPPPEHERELLASFADCGIGAGVAATPAQCERLDTALAAQLLTWHAMDLGQTGPTGWQTLPLLGASFGADYARRALVALKYIGALDSREAFYPMLHADAQGQPLEGSRAWVLRFAPGALPPVQAFWSLTLYDAADCMLVANPLERYAIGDRTPGLQRDADGGLTIHIGHARPADSRAAANWLPAPAGRFYLCLRAYVPHEDMLDGRYQLPPLRPAAVASLAGGERSPLRTGTGIQEVAPGAWVLHGQGQSFVASTSAGLVLVDAGPGGKVTQAMIAALRSVSDAPVHAICYSHGHLGYNAGVPQWLAHARERGEPPPRLVAHRNVPRRYARYRETAALQQHLAGIQFRLAPGSFEIELHDPQELFDDRCTLGEGAQRVELHWAPAETDDGVAVWCPQAGVLYGGAAVIDSIPNVGTPLRTLRDPVRWADTLERLAALRPQLVIREFGAAIHGAREVQQVLGHTARALRWLRSETVRLMNQGLDERQVLAAMTYPPELFDPPWMRPVYGDPSFIVRDIWRSENGWWDRNPTSLHPSAPLAVAQALARAVADKAAVLAEARRLAEAGDLQLALHVIDLLALAEGDAPEIAQARALKAGWLRERAKEIRSYVSRSLYLDGAARLEAHGSDAARAANVMTPVRSNP